MKPERSRVRSTRHTRQGTAGRREGEKTRRGPEDWAGARGDVTMQSEARPGYTDAAAHPLAELLACPPAVANLLNASARCIDFEAGDTIFRQGEMGRGLYVVVSGTLVRRAERLNARITLGTVRAGDLVELAAVLGDGRHTYSLSAQEGGSLLVLPIESLKEAFAAYPPLRMQLLEELAREVSRAYNVCCSTRLAGIRHRGNGASPSL
jgi:Cyclic nucleotide-binding domain